MKNNLSIKKKLLLISPHFLPIVGGAETYILELIHYFSPRGYDIHLLTNAGVNPIAQWKGCHIHYIEGFDDTALVINKCAKGMRKILDDIKPDIVHIHNLLPFLSTQA